jgi:hypothetical protein
MRLKSVCSFNTFRKLVASALVLCIVSVFLLSIGHIFEHARHSNDCCSVLTARSVSEPINQQNGERDECSVCLHIKTIFSVVSRFVLAVFAAAFASLALIAGMSQLKSVSNTACSTLVSLKLQMNN